MELKICKIMYMLLIDQGSSPIMDIHVYPLEMDCLIIMTGLINLNVTSCEKSLRYDR